jgi:hypothetical protein
MFSTPRRPASFSELRGAAHSSPAATSGAFRTGLASAIRLPPTGSINHTDPAGGAARCRVRLRRIHVHRRHRCGLAARICRPLSASELSRTSTPCLRAAAVAGKLKAAGQQLIGGGSETLTKLVEQQKARVLEISKSIELKAAR